MKRELKVMSRTDEIFKELMQGANIEEVRAKHSGSKGPLYAAIAKATEIAVSKFEDARAELQEINTEAAKDKEKIEGLDRDIEDKERRSAEIHKANHDASRALDEKMTELSAKEKLLKRFRAMKTSPIEALKLIGEIKNLRRELAALDEAAKEKERELATLERHLPETKENYEAWKIRRDAEMRKVAEFAQILNAHRVELNVLSQQIAQASAYFGELTRETANAKDMRNQLVDEVRKLRQRRPKLIFIVEGLDTEIIEKRSEIERLVQVSETMAANIMSMGEKVAQVIDAERERGVRIDREFATKITVLRMTYDKFIEQGEAEVERQLRELAGDGIAELPFIMERVEMGRIELLALGTQKGIVVVELEELEAKRREREKLISIPGIVATGS